MANIIDTIWIYLYLFIKLLILLLITYIVYILIFRGYSKFLYNLGTFSFSHKENIDSFIKSNNILLDKLFYIYKIPDINVKIINKIVNLNELKSTIETYDKNSKSLYDNDYYFRTIKEFYIFDKSLESNKNKIITLREKNKFCNNEDCAIQINNYDFYYKLLNYLININEYKAYDDEKGFKKSDDFMIVEIYNIKNKAYTDFKLLNKNIKDIADKVLITINDLISKSFMNYLIIPTYTNIDVFMEELTKNKNINTNHLVLFELLSTSSYDDIGKKMPSFTLDEKKYILHFINSNTENKNKLIEKLKWKNLELFKFLTLYPLFSNIYFSLDNINKKEVYTNLRNVYNILGNNEKDLKTFIKNLNINGSYIKELYLSLIYINLALNTYRTEISNIYGKQLYNDKDFFIEMVQPITNDMIVNRIGKDAKYVFSNKGFKNNFKNFETNFNTFGKKLETIVKNTYKAFFTSNKVEKPKEVKVNQ